MQYRKTVSAPIAPADLETLRQLAKAGDRSVSSLIRLAIRNYIANSEAAPNPGGFAKDALAGAHDPA